jgi:EAL domain-containing protein (putative c-di-GMP-specific phosphodiesterase class I)
VNLPLSVHAGAEAATTRSGSHNDPPAPQDEPAPTASSCPGRGGGGDALARLMRPDALVPAFQPVINLYTGQLVGYEALARWPALSGVHPEGAFQAAAEAGRLAELDWACRLRSLEAALNADLGEVATLFVNVEVATAATPPPAGGADVLRQAEQRLSVMLELTERSLLDQPAELLRLIAEARNRGQGIALDDVGANPDSLALLPFLAPEVIKLDRSLVQRGPSSAQTRTIAAVMAHAEDTGAVVVAEGIETDTHYDQALALGARYGQGWLLGRPGALIPAEQPGVLQLETPSRRCPKTPFQLVASTGVTRVGRKSVLVAMAHHLEDQASSLADPPMVLAAFQTAGRFRPAARRYAALARRCPFVGVLADSLPAEPAPGVHGGSISPADPLLGEWAVVVVGPHYAAALIARDLYSDGSDADRRFRFVVTHHRPTVVAAGRSLLQRMNSANTPLFSSWS